MINPTGKNIKNNIEYIIKADNKTNNKKTIIHLDSPKIYVII